MLRFESTQSGIFDGEIDFTPFDPQLKSKKLPFTLEVTKTELPDTMPIKIFHWDYSGALEPQKLDLLLDGRVNVFHIRDLATLYSAEMPTDFSYYAKVIQAVKKAAPDLDANFVIEEGFIRKNGGWKKSAVFSPLVFFSDEVAGKTLGIVGYGSIGKSVEKREVN